MEIYILNMPVKTVVKSMLHKAFFSLLAAAPGLFLYFNYFSKAMTFSNATFIPAGELTDWLKNMRSLIALNEVSETPYTNVLFYVIVLLVLAGLAVRISNMLYNGEKKEMLRQTLASYHDLLLIGAVAALILYYALPDFHDLAGYNSTRTQLMFFMLIAAWACCQKIPKWVTMISLAVVFFVHYERLKQFQAAASNLSADAVECNKLSAIIEQGSIVYPIDKTDNWLKGHFSNYLGIDKPMVILENYEAGIGYFPLVWNEDKMEKFRKDNFWEHIHCGTMPSGNNKKPNRIDYIFVHGRFPVMPEECDSILLSNIENHFELAGQGPTGSLYRFRR